MYLWLSNKILKNINENVIQKSQFLGTNNYIYTGTAEYSLSFETAAAEALLSKMLKR